MHSDNAYHKQELLQRTLRYSSKPNESKRLSKPSSSLTCLELDTLCVAPDECAPRDLRLDNSLRDRLSFRESFREYVVRLSTPNLSQPKPPGAFRYHQANG